LTVALVRFAVLCLVLGGCGGGSSADRARASPHLPIRSTDVQAPASHQRAAAFPTVSPALLARATRAGLVASRPKSLRDACAHVAARTVFKVLCPALIPPGALYVNFAEGILRSSDLSEGYLISFASPAIRPDRSTPGHWTLSGGSANAMIVLLQTHGGPGAPEPTTQRIEINGVHATLFRVPAFDVFHGMYGGHVVIQWQDGSTTMQVSAHGESNEWFTMLLATMLLATP
jgi:hypothetical protein